MGKRIQKTKRNPISTDWDSLLRLLPGYDPFLTANGCHFDSDAANHALKFFPLFLKHVKGSCAGKPFELQRWQQCVMANLFGWKRPDGTRRFREAFIYVGKKNGKSAWIAGILLYGLVADRESGAEVYSAASSKEQAGLIFSHACGMVKQEKRLLDILAIYGDKGGGQTRSIVYQEKFSTYKVLAADADTVDGVNPHMVGIDELHRHKNPQLSEVLIKSTLTRRQPLVLFTTTADFNRPSACNTKLEYARKVMANKGTPLEPGYDSAFLPCVYECSKDDDWKLPVVWRKANPNMGVTFKEEDFARECQKAQETPSELNNFLRLNLNIVTDSDVSWLSADLWDANAGSVDVEALAGRECFGGLDLSSKFDLTAWVLVFPPLQEDGQWVILPRLWIPADTAVEREQNDRVPYSAWIGGGFMEKTPGNAVDYDWIKQRIRNDAKKFVVKEIAFDPWNALQISIQLGEEGLKCVEFGQGFKSMSEPAKELEKLLRQKRIAHGGHPVLKWMAGNVMLEMDAAGNIKPSKAKSSNRIDGIVGLVMGLGRAIFKKGDEKSAYESQELLVLG